MADATNATNETNKSTATIPDEVAFYEVMKDSYNQRFKLRSRLFKRILQHMEKFMGEESTIYYLMELVKENRKNNG